MFVNNYFEVVLSDNVFEAVPHEMKLVSYFEKRSYLRCTDNFKTHVLNTIEPIIPGLPDMIYDKAVMVRNGNDAIITRLIKLVKGNTWIIEQSLGVISHLIWDQQKGQDGILSITEYNNNFFIEDFVITVGWSDIEQKFICDAVPYAERGKKDFIFYPTFVRGTN